MRAAATLLSAQLLQLSEDLVLGGGEEALGETPGSPLNREPLDIHPETGVVDHRRHGAVGGMGEIEAPLAACQRYNAPPVTEGAGANADAR